MHFKTTIILSLAAGLLAAGCTSGHYYDYSDSYIPGDNALRVPTATYNQTVQDLYNRWQQQHDANGRVTGSYTCGHHNSRPSSGRGTATVC